MSRIRSPNYPALSLPEAIKSVAAIQAAEQHRTAPKEVVAKHIGYTTLHGLAKRMISAIENYGLLEEVTGDKVKVSPLAMSILFPATPDEKQNAINEAAFKHPLFAAIKEEWEGSRPSDENLRVYLIRRKFAADALDRVIEVYKETMDLVTPASGVYPAQQGGQPAKSQEMPPMQPSTNPGAARSMPPPASVPMRVSFNGDLLEVSAVLSDAAAVDRLVKALEANKALLPATAKKEEAAN
jgi:hypothetical protein